MQVSPRNNRGNYEPGILNMRPVNIRPALRKNSENLVIEEIEEPEKDVEELRHKNLEAKQLHKNQTELHLRQRKGSCNIDLPSFLKKAGRKNSDQQSGLFTPTAK